MYRFEELVPPYPCNVGWRGVFPFESDGLLRPPSLSTECQVNLVIGNLSKVLSVLLILAPLLAKCLHFHLQFVRD